jgi:Predicted membrane protein
MSENKHIENVDFEVKWEGKPAGLWQRFLTTINLNFTTYQLTKDELIIQTGFFKRKTNTVELYLLKDPDLTESLYQRWLKIGTVVVIIGTNSASERSGTQIRLKNIENSAQVRKLLRDLIEADVMERRITYLDKI